MDGAKTDVALTAIPYDSAHAGCFEDVVENGNGRPETLGW